MPYYDSFQDDEDELNQQQQEGAPPLAGGTQVTDSGTQSAGSEGGAKPGTSSERFQNLDAYLSANQGSGFGDKFSGKVSSDVEKAKGAQEDASSQFKSAVDQSTIGQDQNLVKSVTDDPWAFLYGGNTSGTSGQTSENGIPWAKGGPVTIPEGAWKQDARDNTAYQPTGTVDERLAKWNSQANAQYKGPNSYADLADPYQKAYGATQGGLSKANAAQTEPGRFALLDEYFGRPQYNQGEKSLDNLLVQGDTGAQQALQQAQANAQNYNQAFQQQGTDLANYATGGRATTDATRQAAQAAGNTALTGSQSAIDKAFADAKAGYKAPELQQQLSTNHLTPENMKYLGLDAITGATWNVNPGGANYFNQGDVPTISNATSLDQQHRLNALQKLMGQSEYGFEAGKAGTMKAPSFDVAKYQGDIANAKNAGMAKLKTMENEIRKYAQDMEDTRAYMMGTDRNSDEQKANYMRMYNEQGVPKLQQMVAQYGELQRNLGGNTGLGGREVYDLANSPNFHLLPGLNQSRDLGGGFGGVAGRFV